jgi:transmembrane sensor
MVAGVASLCLVVVLTMLLVPELSPFSPRYASGRGEQRQVTLTDGSRMVVNTDSEVKVDFDARERTLDLLRGEAYFEVAKDPARPFVVRAGNATVRAIGTKFSVRRDANETEVVVTEGRVQVLREGAGAPAGSEVGPIDLVPGNHATINPAEPVVRIASVDVTRVTAWTSGNVEFDEDTLAEVIRDVNRYTAKAFVIDDPSLNEIRLTGRFRVGDVESVKSALKHRFDIISVEDGRAIRLSR